MRPETAHDPAIQTIEETADVSLVVIQGLCFSKPFYIKPATNDRIDLLDQLPCTYRSLSPRPLPDLIPKVLDRLLSGVRVEATRSGAAADLLGRQPHGSAAALDLVPQKLEAMLDMDNTSLLFV